MGWSKACMKDQCEQDFLSLWNIVNGFWEFKTGRTRLGASAVRSGRAQCLHPGPSHHYRWFATSRNVVDMNFANSLQCLYTRRAHQLCVTRCCIYMHHTNGKEGSKTETPTPKCWQIIPAHAGSLWVACGTQWDDHSGRGYTMAMRHGLR